jgi:uncharacterized protein (TIGR02246 family)
MRRIAMTLVALGISSAALAQTPAQQPPVQPPRSPTYPSPAARSSDATVDQLSKDYESAFNKGDAKALAALYATDGMRLGPNNQLIKGRAAIEQFYVQTFASGKPPTLTIRPRSSKMLRPDVALLEGTYALEDGSGGVYIITAVQQGGQWQLAGVVPVPDTPR